MDIEITEKDSKGYAEATIDGNPAGKMTYNIPNTSFVIIDHTEVEEDYKGQGVGKQMLYRIVDMAREKNMTIFPLCPFAKAMFNKINDIQDVLKS
jgi:predicted GNAT family acetyltransferase